MRSAVTAVKVLQGLCLFLGLAACNGGDGEAESPSLNLQVIEYAQGLLTQKLEGPPARPVVTRAVLDTLEGSFMEVEVEKNGDSAYMYVAAVRQDELPGTIVVWHAEDPATLTLRNDVLIATRGLGDDLLSSAVRINPGQPGPAGGGARTLYVRAFDNQEVALSLACDLVDLGPETIVIVEQAHRTRHLQEDCEGSGGRIRNDYWIDSGAGLVWQSRQWGGPGIGYVQFRRLTTG